MMPAVPSASYLADGLLTVSIFATVLAGMLFRMAFMLSKGIRMSRPLNWNSMPLLPLRVMFSLLSTITPGTFFSISNTLALVAVTPSSTFITILSASMV